MAFGRSVTFCSFPALAAISTAASRRMISTVCALSCNAASERTTASLTLPASSASSAAFGVSAVTTSMRTGARWLRSISPASLNTR